MIGTWRARLMCSAFSDEAVPPMTSILGVRLDPLTDQWREPECLSC